MIFTKYQSFSLQKNSSRMKIELRDLDSILSIFSIADFCSILNRYIVRTAVMLLPLQN